MNTARARGLAVGHAGNGTGDGNGCTAGSAAGAAFHSVYLRAKFSSKWIIELYIFLKHFDDMPGKLIIYLSMSWDRLRYPCFGILVPIMFFTVSY
jgi:hypothetical protein